MKKSNPFFLILIAFFSLTLKAQMNEPSYAVVNSFHLPGDGGWDYLVADEARGWLFVSHGTMVQVMDARSGKILGTIPNTPGVHGIALAPGFNKGFISNGKDTSVTVFNYKTFAFMARIKVTGQNPDAILYDDFSKRVFVFNGRSANATVIDAKTDEILATIPLEGKPEFMVTDGAGKIFVNIEDKGLVTEISATDMKTVKSWSISPGEEPSGLALDNETHRLFSVCGNKLMVISDAANGKVITTLPIGEGTDGVKFDSYYKRAFSSNGDGTITVVQEKPGDQFSVLETVKTQEGARTIELDNKTHRLYLPTAELGPAPEATTENPHPRRTIKADSFVVLDVAFIK